MSKKRPSRAERLENALIKVRDACYIVEELQGELEDWLGNLPENLQQSSKADELQEAIDNLEEIKSNLEQAIDTDVEFPRAFGG